MLRIHHRQPGLLGQGQRAPLFRCRRQAVHVDPRLPSGWAIADVGAAVVSIVAIDFEANAKDGHGSDWPIRYEDLAPWYDHVEKFAGISGSKEGLPQLPDGQFLPPMGLTGTEMDFKHKIEGAWPGRKLIIGRAAHLTQAQPEHEELGRVSCQYRSLCERGCSYGSYFSTLSSTLPAAERTRNLTVVTDAIVHSVHTIPAPIRSPACG